MIKKYSIFIILIGCISFLCIVKSDVGKIKNGTTALILIDSDSIIVAEDSRTMTLDKSGKLSFSDTTCKLLIIGNVVFAPFGTISFPNISLQQVILRFWDKNKRIDENSIRLKNEMQKTFQKEMDNLDKWGYDYYRDKNMDDYGTHVFITAYENNKPINIQISIKYKRIAIDKYVVSDKPIEKITDTGSFFNGRENQTYHTSFFYF